ncbi:MAG: M48 family metallopeptidase [Ruminococcus sp.]|nr:M48 family metallopeptidase [Ruminococcus sp.]
MVREVNYKGTIIKYDLQRKRVKNINLRVKPDLTVLVSANSRVGVKYIDDFVLRKSDFILSAIDKFKNISVTEPNPVFTLEEFTRFISDTFKNVYELFSAEYFINLPQLKMRTMKSRWGSCNYEKCIITLNTNLIYCTEEQINYVIVHEFSHLLVHDHSQNFYKIVQKYCPDYKRIRKEMNKIYI